jgi:hypothetical protein
MSRELSIMEAPLENVGPSANNAMTAQPSVVPERFNSTSGPRGSIVPREFVSTTGDKILNLPKLAPNEEPNDQSFGLGAYSSSCF